MSLKMKNITFLIGMVFLFFFMWGISLFAEPSKGFSGFGETTDLSPDDETLVFSYFQDCNASLYTVPASGGTAKLLAKPIEGNSFINPTFSPNGDKVAFIKQWEVEEQERTFGELMIIDQTNGKMEQLTDTNNLITEAVFSPDGKTLYFLKASVYKNYSEIASKRPHEFDIFRMDLETKAIDQITHKKAYEMSGLAVTPDGKQLMYRSYGNGDQLVFHSLEDDGETVVVPSGEFASGAPIISSPSLSSDGKRVTFSDVATEGKDGLFIYEAFKMDVDTQQAKQITSFHKHVTNPVFFHHSNSLIVTVDEKFGEARSEYSYWRVSMDGDQRKHLSINIPEVDDMK
ncbi:hypothetical protein F3157_08310 [Virgibacillus dakarensis]|nr:hypothetical protein [Virgibacillus dakarensis]